MMKAGQHLRHPRKPAGYYPGWDIASRCLPGAGWGACGAVGFGPALPSTCKALASGWASECHLLRRPRRVPVLPPPQGLLPLRALLHRLPLQARGRHRLRAQGRGGQRRAAGEAPPLCEPLTAGIQLRDLAARLHLSRPPNANCLPAHSAPPRPAVCGERDDQRVVPGRRRREPRGDVVHGWASFCSFFGCFFASRLCTCSGRDQCPALLRPVPSPASCDPGLIHFHLRCAQARAATTCCTAATRWGARRRLSPHQHGIERALAWHSLPPGPASQWRQQHGAVAAGALAPWPLQIADQKLERGNEALVGNIQVRRPPTAGPLGCSCCALCATFPAAHPEPSACAAYCCPPAAGHPGARDAQAEEPHRPLWLRLCV